MIFFKTLSFKLPGAVASPSFRSAARAGFPRSSADARKSNQSSINCKEISFEILAQHKCTLAGPETYFVKFW
jgi:hypothetical protein